MVSWKQIPGYGERYEMTEGGRVRIRDTGRELKATTRYDGYLFYSLTWPGGRTVVLVHTLLLLTFKGPRPAKAVIRHLNGDKRDNRLANLAYGTHLENSADAKLHGAIARGEDNGQRKLTDRCAGAIRRLRGHVPQTVLASWLRVSPAIISAAQLGKTWSHVSDDMTLEEALAAVFNPAAADLDVYPPEACATLVKQYEAQ